MRKLALILAPMVFFWGIPNETSAYIGPGAGAGFIGTVLGIFGALFLAIFAIVYYPIKRKLKKRRADRAGEVNGPDT